MAEKAIKELEQNEKSQQQNLETVDYDEEAKFGAVLGSGAYVPKQQIKKQEQPSSPKQKNGKGKPKSALNKQNNTQNINKNM